MIQNRKNSDTTDALANCNWLQFLNFHLGGSASFPCSGVIILTSYNDGIPSNANKCNVDVIFCGPDSVKMLLENQCYTEYKHTQSLEIPFLKPLVKLLFYNQLELLNCYGTLKFLERKLVFLPGTDCSIQVLVKILRYRTTVKIWFNPRLNFIQ